MKSQENEDIFEALKKDHEKVKKLFKDYEDAGEHATQKKQSIADQVFQELTVHAKIEEEIFYPAVAAETDEEGRELVDEAFEEHHVIKILIGELQSLKAGEEVFEAKFKVLRENVEHHVEEEEDELFPSAKKALDKEDIEEIGEEVEERKEDLMMQM
jgi:hemerythrin superfamily protein